MKNAKPHWGSRWWGDRCPLQEMLTPCPWHTDMAGQMQRFWDASLFQRSHLLSKIVSPSAWDRERGSNSLTAITIPHRALVFFFFSCLPFQYFWLYTIWFRATDFPVEVEAKIAAKYPTRQEATLKAKNFLTKLALLPCLLIPVCWGLYIYIL